MERIYLDYAATTPISQAVLEAMMPYLTHIYGNPSSIHGAGREAHKAVDTARRKVAAAIGSTHQEIFFTSGGSESDNWAIKGAAFALKERGRHIVTSSIEHHAVLHTCQWLEKQGFRVTYLPVDSEGRVRVEDAEKAMTDDTILVSVMMANNEIGTLEPVEELARMAHAHGALFHTDAVQAVGAVEVNVEKIGCDLLSMSAHKFHGPKGVGALYIRKGTRLDTLLHGGAQERGVRAGTENLASIVGMGRAIELAAEGLRENAAREAGLRDCLMDEILREIPCARINGPRDGRLPNNCNVSFDGVEGEALLLRLDLAGVCASSGSACTSGSLDPSHVLTAIGLSDREAHGSLRLTLGAETTMEEIRETLLRMKPIVASLRQMTGWTPDRIGR